MEAKTPYTVSQLNEYIKGKLESDQNLLSVAVQGEISNITFHHSGHTYFTIKDNKSQIKAILFAFNQKNIKFKLKEGLKIIAIGAIKLYAPQGSYSLQVTNISLDGVGELYLKYENLKKELSAKGWFDQSIKKPIPRFPKNIGVVTAATGAAIKDIITTIYRRYNNVNIYLFPCLVQGKDAKFDIQKQIQKANQYRIKLDVLIVGRGGGSLEDLWAFNEIEVLQAIYNSQIPVVSAVGHEIDFMLSDFVADLRAPTPTAAAELVTPNKEELLQYLSEQYKKLIQLIKTKVDNLSQVLGHLKANSHLKHPHWIYEESNHQFVTLKNKLLNLQNEFFQKNAHKIDMLKMKMESLIRANLQHKENVKNQLIAKLDALSPLSILARGYSVTYNMENKAIKSINEVKDNDTILTRLHDGFIHSTVISQSKKKGD